MLVGLRHLAVLACLAGGLLPPVASAADLIVVPARGAGRAEGAAARADAGVALVGRSRAGFELVRTVGDTGAGDAIAALRADPAVASVELDAPVRMATSDRYFPLQWSLQNDGSWGDPGSSLAGADIGAPAAWAVSHGKGVLVAIADTGVDSEHPDLAGRIDGRGWDYIDRDADSGDDNGHGTHIAGILAANAGNELGIAGVAPEATVLPLRVLDASGQGLTSDAVSAFADAGRAGIRIVVAAFGASAYSPAQASVIAANPQTLYVAAAGNDGADIDRRPVYPCSLDLANVICVAASDPLDQPAVFSNFGAVSVDLFAPGDRIVSTWLDDGYAALSGTSMAAPMVAGVAALILSVHPSLSAAAVKQAILSSVAHPDGLAGLSLSGGRLDAAAALESAAVLDAQARSTIASVVQPSPPPVTVPAGPPRATLPATAPPEAPQTARVLVPARVVWVRVRQRGPQRPFGAAQTLSFRLTAVARVTVTLLQRSCGHGHCRWQRRSRRTVAGVRGVNQIALRGRVPRAGRWRAVIAAQQSSRTASFVVAAPSRGAASAGRAHRR